MFATPQELRAQEVWKCSGQIVDAATKEPLVGANIYTEDLQFGTTTDEYGRYLIQVSSKYNKLIASYIGYKVDTCHNKYGSCYFELDVQELQEIVVSAEKKKVQKEIGQFSPSMKQIKRLPALLGDVDIVKAMVLLPGISGGVEGSSGMLVRGGDLSHNLILLDGTPVYNSNHLFGFMSSFNPEAVKHVELYKGGFPVQYGGRLASVLNITMKDGNMQKQSANLSIGLINSSVVTEGPILKNRISYLIAGRMLNLSPILSLGKKSSDEQYGYWLYDFNSKVKLKITPKQSLYLSYFQGDDSFHSKFQETDNRVKWGNKVASIRYNNQLANNVFVDMGAYYNKYAFGSKHEDLFQFSTYLFSTKSTISDLTGRVKVRWVLTPKFRSVIGGELSEKKFTPVEFETEELDSLGNVSASESVLEKIAVRSTTGFYENEWSPFSSLKIRAGIRASFYESKSLDFNDLEWRTSISYKKNNQTIKLAYDEMNQPFHLLTAVGSDSPNEIWIPGTTNVPSSHAQQVSLGYSKDIPNRKLRFSAEVYYKWMNNLVRYKPGSAYFFTQKGDWERNIIGKGIGEAKGFELFVNHYQGRLTGWLGYTLAWSNRKYTQTNHGNWFAANYDRRHDLELVLSYKISKKWNASGTFVWQSGRPLTLPSAFYLAPREPGGVVDRFKLVFDNINGSRTKNYHRLDLSFTRKYRTRRDREASWAFGAYNVYARNNPFSYVVAINDGEGVVSKPPRLILLQKSLFNIIPSINYRLKF